jgi:hypothetical protein
MDKLQLERRESSIVVIIIIIKEPNNIIFITHPKVIGKKGSIQKIEASGWMDGWREREREIQRDDYVRLGLRRRPPTPQHHCGGFLLEM